jgi:hypothetical protein
VGRAAYILVFNIVLWLAIPILLSNQLSQALPSSPLSEPSFLYAFGAAITGLQTLAALTEGMAVSVPFNSGGYVASAYYIWAVTNGGTLTVTTQGISVVLSFTPLLFLLMLAPLFGAVRAPLAFLLEESEVARPSPDEA